MSEKEHTMEDEINEMMDLKPAEDLEEIEEEDPNRIVELEDEEEEEDDDSEDLDEDDSDDGSAEDDRDDEDEDSEDEDQEDSEEEEEGESGEGDKDETASLEERNAQLLEIIKNMSGNVPEKAPEKKKELSNVYESDEVKELVKILELDESEGKVLVGVLKKIQDDTQQRSVEQAMRDTPEVVGKYVNRQAVLKRLKDNFNEKNPQLKEVTSYVVQVANDLSAANADWGMEKCLDEAAVKTYKALGIKKDLAKKKDKPGKRKKPAFAKGTKGSRKKAPKKSKLQNDIQSMLDLD